MDGLNFIAIAMAAIVFTWVGYFLGNFFPTLGKAKKLQLERKASGQKLIDVDSVKERVSQSDGGIDLSFIKRAWKKSVDWLLEREEEEEEPSEGEIVEEQELPDESVEEQILEVESAPMGDLSKEAQAKLRVPEALSIPDDAIFIWHDRHRKKVFAQVDEDILDLDQDMSKDQRGALSLLLVDLQDKVGLSATLKAAIAEETEQAYAEKEKQIKQATVPIEEPVKPPSFNPVKSLINYVTADVPKLEDTPESIPDQINSILQDLIHDTPLRDRGISVANWPVRGVVFIVGIEIYDEIEEIPDPEIQKVIQAAVKRWEETQTAE
jgi:hypothetical protein